MNTLSEFLFPLIFIVAFVLISVRKGTNQKKQEEMAKTTLPGRKGGQELSASEAVSEQSVQVKTGKSHSVKSKPVRYPENIHSEFAQSDKEIAEEIEDSALNVEDVGDVKKAVIYTEIFNRKPY